MDGILDAAQGSVLTVFSVGADLRCGEYSRNVPGVAGCGIGQYAISAITEHAPCLTGLPSRQVGEDPTCQGPTESTRPAPSSLTGVSTRRWGSRRSFCSLIRRLDTPSRAASRLSRRLKSLVSGFNWSSPSARSRPHRRCAGTRTNYVRGWPRCGRRPPMLPRSAALGCWRWACRCSVRPCCRSQTFVGSAR